MARIGLLPRVRCLRSLISANTPAEFSRAGRRRDFSLFGVLIILSRVWPWKPLMNRGGGFCTPRPIGIGQREFFRIQLMHASNLEIITLPLDRLSDFVRIVLAVRFDEREKKVR